MAIERSSSSNRTVWLIVALVAIVAIVALVYFFSQNQQAAPEGLTGADAAAVSESIENAGENIADGARDAAQETGEAVQNAGEAARDAAPAETPPAN